MESLTLSRLTRSASKNPSSHLPSPIKPPTMSAAPSPLKSAVSGQIPTPEKPIELPRRTRNRSMALSVKEVKRAALGLQRPGKSPSDRSDLAGSGNDLLSVEQQLGADSKPDSISKPSKNKAPVKLLEKYEMLVEFFNCMESSIRLLRLKGSVSSFPNICNSIQHLTERRFTHGHLAQLKYILPEAISIKKVLLHDETTCCVKPDLQVTLHPDAIADSLKRKGESDHSLIRRLFRERLIDFSKNHLQGDDVPEEMLPHPFNQTKASLPSNMERVPTNSMFVEPLSNVLSHQQFGVPSHMSGSFQRRFSLKTPIPDEEKTPLSCLSKASLRNNHPISAIPSIKCIPSPPLVSKKLPLGSHVALPSLNTSGVYEEETKKLTSSQNCSRVELNILEGTPAKSISTRSRLMTSTPDLQTPKRSCPTGGYDSPPLKKSNKRSTRTKLMFTTPKKTEDEANDPRCSTVDGDILSFLPKALLQSIRNKERKTQEEREAGTDEAKRRQKLLSCLPSIFDVILLIFQSGQRSIMTKQELIRKIIASHSKIVDRGEVEEQLKLLQELVPEWILEKVASSGDTLCYINKTSSPEEFRRRLTEAE